MEDNRVLRAEALLTELASMRGLVPYEFRRDFEVALNAYLPVRYFAPRYVPPRPKCEWTLRNGNRCTHNAMFDQHLCSAHIRAFERRLDREQNPPAPKPKCTQNKADGQPCQAFRMGGSTACKRHAIRDNMMPEVPTECAICYDEMTADNATGTKCGHYFHKSCMTTWVTSRMASYQKVSCPMCRTSLPRPRPRPTPVVHAS
jgi:hypothetical protein